MASVKLGEDAPYSSHYDPTLLEAIPRLASREGLFGDLALPFAGADIWTAYELSWLTEKGKPEVAIAEFSFPFDSTAIIESKSFKYYLNSYNQTTFVNRKSVADQLIKDLTAACGAPVSLTLFSIDEYARNGRLSGRCVDDLSVEINCYQPNRELLQCGDQHVAKQALYSHLLKSNCPVTGQPDWATVWVYYSGREIVPESFLRYVVSFRQHQDFHENCVEKIFCDVMAKGDLDELAVYARYTRRGGLDINPLRATPNIAESVMASMACIRIARQ